MSLQSQKEDVKLKEDNSNNNSNNSNNNSNNSNNNKTILLI
jgi:hypothetical protein